MNSTNPFKQAIIGCAFYYNTEAVLPFLNSLEASGFKGDLILFINNDSDIAVLNYSYRTVFINPDKEFSAHIEKHQRYLSKLKRYNLQKLQKIIVFQYVKWRVRNGKSLPDWCIAYFYTFYNLMTFRFLLYYYFIQDKAYESVLFTDVSDVIFQGYPFLSTAEDNVHVFSENVSVTISQEAFTSYWIKEGFGERVFTSIADKPVYCGGTIIAGNRAIITFLKDFIKLVINHDISPAIDGIDQGVLNYMISYLKKPYFCTKQNGEHVFTVGLQKEADIVCAGGKIYLKGKQETAPGIIHQYNRHLSLTNYINAMYRSNKLTSA